jgi:hypothetical protein
MTRRSVQDALLATNNVREFFIVAAAAQGPEMDPGPGFQPLFPSVANFAAGNTLDMVRPTEKDFVNAGYIYGAASPDPSTQPITLLAQGLVTLESYAYVWMYFQQPYDNAEALAAVAAAAAAKKGGAPAAKSSSAAKA